MSYLLDTNALIALIDPSHVFYRRTLRWFASVRDEGLMTCPLVENGAVRIMSGRGYSERRLAPAEIVLTVQRLRQTADITFVPDDISLADESIFDHDHLATAGQVTDTYLLALAAQHGAFLATHDRRLVTSAVRHPAANVILIT